MSGNAKIKIQNDALIQLAKDTRLNKFFKLLLSFSKAIPDFKANFMLRKFNCHQFGPNL